MFGFFFWSSGSGGRNRGGGGIWGFLIFLFMLTIFGGSQAVPFAVIIGAVIAIAAFLTWASRAANSSGNGADSIDAPQEYEQRNTSYGRSNNGQSNYGQQLDTMIDANTPLNERAPINVARDAIRAAGNVPDDRREAIVTLRDIGILGYDENQKATIYREQAIGADVRYLRPFIVVRVHVGQGANGTILMQLVDGAQQVRFASNERYALKEGDNLVSSKTYLRMGDTDPGGGWFVTVTIGGERMAQHRFYIQPDANAIARTAIGDDGELAIPIETSTQRLSLDELLNDTDQANELSAGSFLAPREEEDRRRGR